MCDNNLPSLAVSIFSCPEDVYLAAFTSAVLHAAMKLSPSSVMVSTHTSASNTFTFQSSAMPIAPMSLSVRNRSLLSPSHGGISSDHRKDGNVVVGGIDNLTYSMLRTIAHKCDTNKQTNKQKHSVLSALYVCTD